MMDGRIYMDTSQTLGGAGKHAVSLVLVVTQYEVVGLTDARETKGFKAPGVDRFESSG